MDKNKKLGLGIVIGVPVALAGVVGATLAMQKPDPTPQEDQIITSTNPDTMSAEVPGLVVGENLEHFKDFGAKVRAQANIINTAIKAREDLTNFVPTIPNEETEPAPVIQADEGYELPQSYSSLQATNIHLEDDVYGFSFEKDIPYEVIGYFEGDQTNRMKVISLKILNKPVEKFGWEIILFPKGDKWYFDFTRGHSNGVYNSEEISIELRGDIALELNNQLRSHFKFNAVEDIPEPTWREKFGASELAISEHPRINYPPKRLELVEYQAPIIEVPSQNLGIFASNTYSSKFDSFFSDDPSIEWYPLKTYTQLGDDPIPFNTENWNYENDKLSAEDLKRNNINLRDRKHTVYQREINDKTYYLEYADNTIGSEKYRLFYYKTGVATYLHPTTGAELKIGTSSTPDKIGEAEFDEGSSYMVYKIARFHKAWESRQIE